MRRSRKQSVLVGLQAASPQSRFFHLDRGDLDYIVEMLNRKPQGGTSPYADALIRLMERLKECGGNLKEMMDGDSELAKVVPRACTTLWLPSKTGRAHLVLQPSTEIKALSPMPEPQEVEKRAELLAALLFHVGTLNPEWDKLAGPCARCGRYYLKKRASQNVYCRRKCGNAATAGVRTRERIDAEHKAKMNHAKTAIKDWKRAKTQEDWKRWVSQETGINLRFLTRNFTETGEVKPAQKEK
jgi:hypothetical protein